MPLLRIVRSLTNPLFLRGKHTPMGDEDVRQNHKTKKDGDVEADEIFPAVTIRDPSKFW